MTHNHKYRVGILSTHPIQYYVPFYRLLSNQSSIDLTVYFCHRQTAQEQVKSDYGIPIDWGIPMLEGYEGVFLDNKSSNPNVFDFFGCNNPDIKNIIKEGNFDAFIIEGWSKLSFWQAIITCWRSKINLMVRGDSNLDTHSGNLINRIIKYPVYNWFIPKFNAYLIVGARAKEYYLHYGANEDKMFFAPHSVDNQFFSEHKKSIIPRRNEIRKKWGIPENAIVFVLVCSLIPRKRPFDFIKAIQKASEVNSNIWGLIVGDGILKNELQKTVTNSNINVHMAGFLNQMEIPMAYAVSDCLVSASRNESWGLTVNEAMASELPLLISDSVGCAPDLVSTNETGLLFKSGDIKSLTQQMIYLASDKNKLQNMGMNAFNLIRKYSVQETVNGTVKAIESTSNKIYV